MVKKMISFTPNTITYAVPINSDLGKRIERKNGYCFSYIILWKNYG